MRMHLTIAVLAATMTPSAAFAQGAPAAPASPTLAAGAVVYDPQGGEVGKIISLSGDAVIVDTGTNKATLPRSAFATGTKGPSINVTKAQLDEMVVAAAAKTSAARDAALVVGAQVHGKAGAMVGTVKEVTGDQVLIDRPEGAVSLSKNAFTVGAAGLTIWMTTAELEAAAKSAASPAPAPAQ